MISRVLGPSLVGTHLILFTHKVGACQGLGTGRGGHALTVFTRTGRIWAQCLLVTDNLSSARDGLIPSAERAVLSEWRAVFALASTLHRKVRQADIAKGVAATPVCA